MRVKSDGALQDKTIESLQIEITSSQDALLQLHPSSFIPGFTFVFPKSISSAFDYRGKRYFDIIIGLLMLLATSPIMLITMLFIWLSTLGKAPVFCRQIRTGLHGELFDVIKFRSMVPDAERNGAQMASRNDIRVTRIGRFIRKTRIDELPQLINVLKGEMSIVGPRPERPEFVDEFKRKIKGYTLRNAVKPGITGWAQVLYPYGETVKDAENKLFFDLIYIRNISLVTDLNILFKTIPVVLTGRGAR